MIEEIHHSCGLLHYLLHFSSGNNIYNIFHYRIKCSHLASKLPDHSLKRAENSLTVSHLLNLPQLKDTLWVWRWWVPWCD